MIIWPIKTKASPSLPSSHWWQQFLHITSASWTPFILWNSAFLKKQYHGPFCLPKTLIYLSFYLCLIDPLVFLHIFQESMHLYSLGQRLQSHHDKKATKTQSSHCRQLHSQQNMNQSYALYHIGQGRQANQTSMQNTHLVPLFMTCKETYAG